MIYYRVKPQFDGRMIRKSGFAAIANELFTYAELQKYSKPDKSGYCLKPHWVEKIALKKSQIYHAFGTRMQTHQEY